MNDFFSSSGLMFADLCLIISCLTNISTPQPFPVCSPLFVGTSHDENTSTLHVVRKHVSPIFAKAKRKAVLIIYFRRNVIANNCFKFSSFSLVRAEKKRILSFTNFYLYAPTTDEDNILEIIRRTKNHLQPLLDRKCVE